MNLCYEFFGSVREPTGIIWRLPLGFVELLVELFWSLLPGVNWENNKRVLSVSEMRPSKLKLRASKQV